MVMDLMLVAFGSQMKAGPLYFPKVYSYSPQMLVSSEGITGSMQETFYTVWHIAVLEYFVATI